MNKITATIALPLRFSWAMATGGIQTVGVILRNGLRIGTAPLASFVRIEFAPMSTHGTALLGCMISLTPGTTVIAIDLDTRQMVLHMLDARDAAVAVEAIRRDFERPLLAWFGARA